MIARVAVQWSDRSRRGEARLKRVDGLPVRELFIVLSLVDRESAARQAEAALA